VLAAVESVEAAIGMVLSLGLEPDTAEQANGLLEALETVSRRVEAGHVQLMDRIDINNLWTTDGMLSAKTMVRHRTGVSSAEAGARLKVVKCCRLMPATEAAYRAGQISTCNMRRLAHTFSNKRVRRQLVEVDEVMCEQAAGLSALEFKGWVGGWESLTDEDGTCDTNQRNHEKRDARMVQDFDKGWTFEAWCAAFQGAEMYKIWAKFIDVEFKTDWAKAVATHGEGNVNKDMLERSDGNRAWMPSTKSSYAPHPPNQEASDPKLLPTSSWTIRPGNANSPNSPVPIWTHRIRSGLTTGVRPLMVSRSTPPKPSPPVSSIMSAGLCSTNVRSQSITPEQFVCSPGPQPTQ